MKSARSTTQELQNIVHDLVDDVVLIEDLLLDIEKNSDEYPVFYQWAISALMESPTGAGLLKEAAHDGCGLAFADLGTDSYFYDCDENVLVLDSNGMRPETVHRFPYFKHEAFIHLIRGLRDVWHDIKNGHLDCQFAPVDQLNLNRVRCADIETMTIRICWELRSLDHPEAWRHIIGSEYGDMALVFSRFLEHDPTALSKGRIMMQTFRQWYTDHSRSDSCDHEILELIDLMMIEDREYDEKSFGSEILKAQHIEFLGCMPDGTSYLLGAGDAILRDPLYAGMRDPVNQAHLFHIMYDLEATVVHNVPFRDAELARKIFPSGLLEETEL